MTNYRVFRITEKVTGPGANPGSGKVRGTILLPHTGADTYIDHVTITKEIIKPDESTFFSPRSSPVSLSDE